MCTAGEEQIRVRIPRMNLKVSGRDDFNDKACERHLHLYWSERFGAACPVRGSFKVVPHGQNLSSHPPYSPTAPAPRAPRPRPALACRSQIGHWPELVSTTCAGVLKSLP